MSTIYGLNKRQINISLNIVSIYHSIKGPNYINYFPPQAKADKENNDFVGCIHNVHGQGTINLSHTAISIKNNEFIFIRHHDIISLKGTNTDWEFYAIWFYSNNIQIPFNIPKNIEIDDKENEDFFKILSLIQKDNYYDTCIANSICQKFICYMIPKVKTEETTSPYTKIMNNAIVYINQNINNKISVSELSKSCGFCENQFCIIFKKHFKKTPKQYIISAKLEKAAFLLSQSSMSILDISYELSFNSLAYFTSSFKKYYKCTPSQYRNNLR